jgi:hypothetical protein
MSVLFSSVQSRLIKPLCSYDPHSPRTAILASHEYSIASKKNPEQAPKWTPLTRTAVRFDRVGPRQRRIIGTLTRVTSALRNDVENHAQTKVLKQELPRAPDPGHRLVTQRFSDSPVTCACDSLATYSAASPIKGEDAASNNALGPSLGPHFKGSSRRAFDQANHHQPSARCGRRMANRAVAAANIL